MQDQRPASREYTHISIEICVVYLCVHTGPGEALRLKSYLCKQRAGKDLRKRLTTPMLHQECSKGPWLVWLSGLSARL